MINWFKHRDKIEQLQERYKRLMRKSFELALKDKRASDIVHQEAEAIKRKIHILKFKSA